MGRAGRGTFPTSLWTGSPDWCTIRVDTLKRIFSKTDLTPTHNQQKERDSVFLADIGSVVARRLDCTWVWIGKSDAAGHGYISGGLPPCRTGERRFGMWRFTPPPPLPDGCTPIWLAMGAIHKMAATLGDSPTARALRGNFSSQRSLLHLAKHFSLGFLLLLRAKKPRTNKNLSGSIPPSRRNAIFAFTRLRYRIKVRENSWDLRLSATCDGRAESDAGISEKPNWFRCTGSHYNRKGPSVSSTSRETSFSSSLIVQSIDGELNISCSFRVHYTCTVCGKLGRSGRREEAVMVTKARWITANTKPENQNSQNARCGTLFCGENKTQPKASLAADNRSPCHCTSHASLQCCTLFCVRCSESRTAHLSSIRKNRKIFL